MTRTVVLNSQDQFQMKQETEMELEMQLKNTESFDFNDHF